MFKDLGYQKVVDENGIDFWVGKIPMEVYTKYMINEKPQNIFRKALNTIDKIVVRMLD